MELDFKIKNKNYKIKISEQGNKEVKIKVGEKEFLFAEKEKEQRKVLLPKTSLPKRNFSKKEIKAPIAGMVSEIFIQEGEFIKKGKKILLLSAMKMENEIISEFKGRVKKILVKKNQEVAGEKTLVILE